MEQRFQSDERKGGGKVDLMKIQPPRLIVLFWQEKPQMPVVKQRLYPFFGCELRLAVGCFYSKSFSLFCPFRRCKASSVKMSQGLLSAALFSSHP